MKEKLSALSNPVIQSSLLRVQAAGSDGTDGTVRGMHVRWAFEGDLGKQHLPKGNYVLPPENTTPTGGYNKTNDFVKLYRAPLTAQYPVTLDFTQTPTRIEESGSNRIWHYEGLVPVPSDTSYTTHVALHFVDYQEYDTLRASNDPTADPLAFLTQYTGILDLVPQNKLAYGVNFKAKGGVEFQVIVEVGNPDVPSSGNGGDPPSDPLVEDTLFLRIETLSVKDADDVAPSITSSRVEYIYEGNTALKKTIYGHNIERVRFQYQNRVPYEATLFLYQDTLKGIDVDQGGWEHLGDYALSLDDTEVFTRLEDSGNFSLDGNWPKYNAASPQQDGGDGRFTVKTQNYKDKWSGTGVSYGIKQGVTDYLSASHEGSRGGFPFLLNNNRSANNTSVVIDMIDPLLFASMDFHIARMLGLSYIDTEPASGTDTQEYCYVITYEVANPFGMISTRFNRTHLSMALPTNLSMHRQPPTPILADVNYGITSDTSNPNPVQFSDSNGYDLLQPVRYVNLVREALEYQPPVGNFFEDSTPFELATQSQPVMYGIEYRRTGEASLREPEILHDPDFTDPFGLFEVAAIPEVDGQYAQLYTHRETESGIHEYQLYAVNWFSRPGQLSNMLATDETAFPKRNTLLPPQSIAVQLIQEEADFRVFTTETEQTKLANLVSPDKTLVRVLWQWQPYNLQAYQWARSIQFLHRQGDASTARGTATMVSAVSNSPNLFDITVGPYEITSRLVNGATISEYMDLTASNKERFIGGVCTVGSQPYTIEAIDLSGSAPVLTVRAQREVSMLDPYQNNRFSAGESYTAPTQGARMTIVEDLTNPNNWDVTLQQEVALTYFHTAENFRLETAPATFDALQFRKAKLAGSDTELTAVRTLTRNAIGLPLHYELRYRINSVTANTLVVATDLTGRQPTSVRVEGSGLNDGIYTVTGQSVTGGMTTLTVTETVSDTERIGYAILNESATVTGQDATTNTLTLAGNLTDRLILPLWEMTTGQDGSDTHVIKGGFVATAENIVEIDDGGSPPQTDTGIFKISWNAGNEPKLPLPVTPETDWYQGTIYILEDPQYFPTGSREARNKALQVIEYVAKNANPKADGYLQLQELIVQDPTHVPNSTHADPDEDYMPIMTGTNISINLHPGYRTYLTAEAGFDESALLPAQDTLRKVTYFGLRATDITEGFVSPPSMPVGILAQNLTEPEAPEAPTGANYATRPDFFGKSSYTFDTKVNTTGRQPNALIFLRTNDQNLLSALYTQNTIDTFETATSNLSDYDQRLLEDAWRELVLWNLDQNNPELFKEFDLEDGSKTRFFPNPDHPDLFGGTIPNPIPNPGIADNNGAHGKAIQAAIQKSFIPLTEQPVAYAHIQDGRTTYNRAPTLFDDDGNLYPPTHENFDPFPMVSKFLVDGDTMVRFSDFKLDGASNALWFYAARELSTKMKFGPFSPIKGPVRLLNATPPIAPQLKKTTVQLANPIAGTPAGITFQVNQYLPSAKVEKLRVYRATNATDAKSVRTMHQVTTDFPIADVMVDTFDDLDTPPYGEVLYYRLVALRRMINETGGEEWIPSKASAQMMANLIDNVNPSAPELTANFTVPDPPNSLNGVSFSWPRTTQRAKYTLYKMTSAAQWKPIFRVRTLDDAHAGNYVLERQQTDGTWIADSQTYSATDPILVTLVETTEATTSLTKVNEDGDSIYHRFKVDLENSSGLSNRTSKEITI